MKKNIISLTIVLTAFCSVAHAEDLSKPTITPTTLSASKNIEAPKLSRKNNAILSLNLIRDEVDKIESGFLGRFFVTDSEIQTTLLHDIDIFVTSYNDLDLTAKALFIKGLLQQKQGNHEAAAVTWLQSLFEFPSADVAIEVKQHLIELTKNNLKDHATILQNISRQASHESRPERLHHLMIQLYPILDRKITKALIDLQIDFLKRYPNSIYADSAQILLAHNLGARSAESGVYGFKKLLALYPNSAYRPEAMLAIADLQRIRLKTYDQAASNYKAMIKAYPDHQLLKHAYNNLASIQEKHLKNYTQAIITYQTVVKRYPEDTTALHALQSIAEIQKRKTKDLHGAVTTLRQLATMFKGNEAIGALEEAITISRKAIKDYALTRSTQQQLLRDFPNSKAAPRTLFNMATYAEKTGQGTDLYQQLIKQYPHHKLARKASKRLAATQ